MIGPLGSGIAYLAVTLLWLGVMAFLLSLALRLVKAIERIATATERGQGAVRSVQ
jgi:hypothetical protein